MCWSVGLPIMPEGALPCGHLVGRRPAPSGEERGVVRHHIIDLARTTQDDGLGEAAVCAFTSAHGVALSRALSQSPLRWERFFLWCRTTRRFPSRRSDPARLVHEATKWVHANDARAEAAKARLATDETPFPAPPFPDALDGPLSARAIRDARALHSYGAEMQHCVYAAHVERAVAGDDCIYGCSHGGLRFTLAIRRENDEWFFGAASGLRNRSLTEPEREVLDRWLASNRVATVCDESG